MLAHANTQFRVPDFRQRQKWRWTELLRGLRRFGFWEQNDY
ncbi:MAG: hypothetical protein ACE5I1_08385 [bacterium]